MLKKTKEHPLLTIRPRRMYAQDFRRYLYRRDIRDRLLAQGVTSVYIDAQKTTKNHDTGKTYKTPRVHRTDIEPHEKLVMVGDKKVDTQGAAMFMLENMHDGVCATCWNLESDVLENIWEKKEANSYNQAMKNMFPDPCYSQDPIKLRTNKTTLEHMDPPLPDNPIPETQRILDLMHDLKIEIANLVREDYPCVSEDSLQRVISYISPRIPYAWKDPKIERTLAVWNLHQYHMHSLHPAIQMKLDMERNLDQDTITGEKYPYMKYSNMIHPHGHRLGHNKYADHHILVQELELRSVYGIGSDEHIQMIFRDITALDWPLHKTVNVNYLLIGERRINKFKKNMKQAVQDLLNAVFPDQELFQAILKYPYVDHHMFYNFVQEHPNLRQGAIKCTGVVYAAMVSKIHALGERDTIQTYHCIHGYNRDGHKSNWSLGSSPMSIDFRLEKQRIEDLEEHMPVSKMKTLIRDDNCKMDHWLGAIYSPETIAEHPKNKLIALMERIPVTYHKYLYDGCPPCNIPDFLTGGEDGEFQLALFCENPLYSLLLPNNPLKKSILSLPIEKFPITSLEWTLAKYLMIKTSFSKYISDENEGQQVIRYLMEEIGLMSRREREELSSEPVLMTGLWKHYVGLLRDADDKKYSRILKNIHHHVLELHHILDEFKRQHNTVLKFCHNIEDRRVFLEANQAFILKLATYGKKKQEKILERWTRYSPHLSTLTIRDINASKHEEKSWKPLLEKPITRDDYTVHEITTRARLAIHGSKMNHCVAAYYKRCLSSHRASHILEFTHQDTPVATAEFIESSGFKQIKEGQFLGRYNKPIKDSNLLALHNEALKCMSGNYNAEWEKEATIQKDLVVSYEEQQQGIYRSSKQREQDERICGQWQWQLLRRILPELPDLPPDPNQAIPALPDWIPA